jgi:hypothetical protein
VVRCGAVRCSVGGLELGGGGCWSNWKVRVQGAELESSRAGSNTSLEGLWATFADCEKFSCCLVEVGRLLVGQISYLAACFFMI